MKREFTCTYEIFKSSEYNYPELLIGLLDNKNSLQYEKSRAQSLLGQWVNDYKAMSNVERNPFTKVIFSPKLLTKCIDVYKKGNDVTKFIGLVYGMLLQKWGQLTKYIKTELEASNIQALKLIWKISSTSIQQIASLEQIKFSKFLSFHFQAYLRKYKWQTHPQKIYLLQTVKYLNSYKPCKEFTINCEEWKNIIIQMKSEKFVSQKKQPGQYYIPLHKYEEDLEKKERPEEKSSPKKTNKKPAKSEKKDEKKIEITPFIVVRSEEEQAKIYQAELIKQTIQCRSLLCLVNEDFWDKEVFEFLNVFEREVQHLNNTRVYDLLLVETLDGLLKLQKVETLIRQNIDERIIVPIIRNMEKKESPFHIPTYSNIPLSIKSIYLIPKQNLTIQQIIWLRIKSIIQEGIQKRDDLVNRYMMTVCCLMPITLQKHQFLEIIAFIINQRRKGNILIETQIILISILEAALDSPDANDVNFMNVFKILPDMVESFVGSQKMLELRKLTVNLFLKIIRNITFDEDNEEVIIKSILYWLEVAEINFTEVYVPMLEILCTMTCKFTQTLHNMDLSSCQKILQGISFKLSKESTQEELYSFLNCLILKFCYLKFDMSYTLYTGLNKKILPLVFQQQASIIFKKMEIQKSKSKTKSLEIVSKVFNKGQNKNANNKTPPPPPPMTPESSQKFYRQKYTQMMSQLLGPKQIQWIFELIDNVQIWQNSKMVRIHMNLLQEIIINGVIEAQNQFFIKYDCPNHFYQEIIVKNDEKLLKLFERLIESQLYQELFLFCVKIFIPVKDYWLISSLQSYKLLKAKVFSILSVHFNKNQVLFASSFFCSLLLPYIDKEADLRNVYDHLNQEEFITDLYKGSNDFMSVQKKYSPWLSIILITYLVTEPFRDAVNISPLQFISLNKNLQWWEDLKWEISGELLPEEDLQQMKQTVFETNREKYQEDVAAYYQRFTQVIKKLPKQRNRNLKKE